MKSRTSETTLAATWKRQHGTTRIPSLVMLTDVMSTVTGRQQSAQLPTMPLSYARLIRRQRPPHRETSLESLTWCYPSHIEPKSKPVARRKFRIANIELFGDVDAIGYNKLSGRNFGTATERMVEGKASRGVERRYDQVQAIEQSRQSRSSWDLHDRRRRGG